MSETEWEKNHKWFQVGIQVMPEFTTWMRSSSDQEWEEYPDLIVAAITYHLHEVMDIASEVQPAVMRSDRVYDSRIVMSHWDPYNSVDWFPMIGHCSSMDDQSWMLLTFTPRGVEPKSLV